MASILRTLVEQHDLSIPEAVQILRKTLDAEESEAGQTKAVNLVLMGLSALGGLASMTNPIGLTVAGIAIAVNWSCQSAHRKDYAAIRDEQGLVHHAPMVLDAMLQYSAANIATESTLIAAYEHCLSIFDEDEGICVTSSQIEGTGQYQHMGFEPTQFFRSIVGSAISTEDPVLKVAGKKTGLERMYERMGVEMPKEPSQPTTPTIGTNTRPNALPVASQPTRQPDSIPTGLSSIVADPYQSRAFFGAQRTGKSYLAAVASKEISDSLSCKIFHMNLASFGDEDSYYWSHAVESLQCDLSSMDGYESKQIINQAIDIVKRFYSQQNALLIVDEIAYLGSASNQHSKLLEPLLTLIADKITTLSSSGKKRQQAIWTIAPEFVAGSLTQDAKAVKKLKLCYVASHPDRALDWNGQSISFDWELFRQIKANFEILEPNSLPSSDRVCFVGSHWLPIGELPDLKKMATPKPDIVDPVQHLERSLELSAQSEKDSALELIHSIENLSKREAMLIAYQWAQTRIKDDREVDKASFMARARNDRNCDYLRENRDAIWDELETLIS
ncbi:MAG: hypothetical protein KME18_18135 [Phormidium tanganyikae FI6-MK23]|jgi:hypothetical protein|nr:hypothetical protein [Phormidium tanganyikae FI6-MK23]